jgi:hypothetical protein
VVQLGPLQINSQEDHTIWIPTAAGIAAVMAGVGLVFAGKRAAQTSPSPPAAMEHPLPFSP